MTYESKQFIQDQCQQFLERKHFLISQDYALYFLGLGHEPLQDIQGYEVLSIFLKSRS